MNTVTVQLSDSMSRQVEELARQDGITPDQFMALAAAEKVSALRTAEYLREEGAKGSRKAWDALLAKVPARPPLPGDELPEDLRAELERTSRQL